MRLITVVLLLLLALPAVAQVEFIGGVTFDGHGLEPSIQGSYVAFHQPFTLRGDLMWIPTLDRVALGLATPVSTLTDPLLQLIGAKPEPWVGVVTDSVWGGLAVMRNGRFPYKGALYWQVKLQEWNW